MFLFRDYLPIKTISYALTLALTLSVGVNAAEVTTELSGKFLGAKETIYPAWFKESFLEFAEDVGEAADAGKRTMILFTQDGCPYCNALVERNLSQKNIEALMRDKFDVIAINIWGDREILTIDEKALTEKQFSAAMKVQFTPTLLFLDESGSSVLRLNGYLPPQRMLAALNYVSERKEGELSFRDFVAKAPAKSTGSLRQAAFFKAPPYDFSEVCGPMAVFFEQRDCPSCRVLHEKPLNNPQTQSIAGRMYSVQLDMWSDQALITPAGKRTTAKAWAKALNVSYAPTIIVFDEGKEVIRSEAEFKTFHTQSILDYGLSKGYKKQPNFQRFLEARADHLREQGIDVNIWD